MEGVGTGEESKGKLIAALAAKLDMLFLPAISKQLHRIKQPALNQQFIHLIAFRGCSLLNNLFQISRANESPKKSHFSVKFWPVRAASQTDAVSILLKIKWPDPSAWPWPQVMWPDFSLWASPLCQTDPTSCCGTWPWLPSVLQVPALCS